MKRLIRFLEVIHKEKGLKHATWTIDPEVPALTLVPSQPKVDPITLAAIMEEVENFKLCMGLLHGQLVFTQERES